MLFYHKGLWVRKTPLPFVACARKAAILRVQFWSAHESDVVGLGARPPAARLLPPPAASPGRHSRLEREIRRVMLESHDDHWDFLGCGRRELWDSGGLRCPRLGVP